MKVKDAAVCGGLWQSGVAIGQEESEQRRRPDCGQDRQVEAGTAVLTFKIN
jgi:hypothetical protein